MKSKKILHLCVVAIAVLSVTSCGTKNSSAIENNDEISDANTQEQDEADASSYQSVEITKDNIYDYFEEMDHETWVVDTFGDTIGVTVRKYLVPKEGYKDINVEETDIAIKFRQNWEWYKVNVDLSSKKWELGEKAGEPYDTEEQSTSGRYDLDWNDSDDIEIMQFCIPLENVFDRGRLDANGESSGQCESGYLESYEIIDAKGTLTYK